MQTPNFVNATPERVEIFVNDEIYLSNTGYSTAMLQVLYIHYLHLYWHRKLEQVFSFAITIQHIAYWRSQVKFLGSDMVRRNLLSTEQLNEDIRFALSEPVMQQTKLQDGLVVPVVTKVTPAF